MDSVMKQIKFSKVLVTKAELSAKEKGLTFGEYIRHLIVNDTDSFAELADNETEKNIIKSLNDMEKGRYTVLKSSSDIKNHFEKLRKKIKKTK